MALSRGAPLDEVDAAHTWSITGLVVGHHDDRGHTARGRGLARRF